MNEEGGGAFTVSSLIMIILNFSENCWRISELGLRPIINLQKALFKTI